MNWKGKKAADKRKKAAASAAGVADASSAGYKPPAPTSQFQNRIKARRFYHPKNNNNKFTRFAPYAPRNTTSFIIRAKKSGGITSLVSPCPVTPAILPTPKFSPSREGSSTWPRRSGGSTGMVP
ncbi:von Willebrand factor A domain-containing protein-like [Iris pallida]|uniref:von Willebrand factor A domain-containing protein-like n=1 Tax=Iris pallida TaxID=29817 RepID=A0AAX6HLJ2_IRIPA|nr:von Willebrand factor A domain-containing protein-like [Iris pallida]